jgi:hypothetical protein
MDWQGPWLTSAAGSPAADCFFGRSRQCGRCNKTPDKQQKGESQMAPRERAKIVVKRSDPDEPAEEHTTQRKRPESGRFRLQVDRQTKSSYATYDDAEAAGLTIKKQYPIVQVTVYDAAEATSKIISLSNEAGGQPVN